MGYLLFLAAIIVFFLFLITRTYLQSRREEKEYRDRILYHFGEQSPEKISAARKQKIADGYKRRNREFYIDDITWKDLQMDEVYDRLAFVETQAGEESLYEILRTPLTDPELLAQRELQIRYFQEHPKERAACQMLFHRLSVKKCSRSLYEQLEQLEKAPEQKAVSDYLAVWLVLFSVIMILWNFPVMSTIGRIFPSLSIKVNPGTSFSLATLASSAPKVGAVCTIPVPSSVVTKSPATTRKGSPSAGCAYGNNCSKRISVSSFPLKVPRTLNGIFFCPGS